MLTIIILGILVSIGEVIYAYKMVKKEDKEVRIVFISLGSVTAFLCCVILMKYLNIW